ncbi:MAG: restriction endonuclease [Bacillota bacterium]|nr:restriction endonuclease [Bacillota bacterium]
MPVIKVSDLSDYDSVRDYLSKEEYAVLSETERNQLALDRYKKSHNRTKWQIGRDYELYVGYKYTQKGYDVDYFGSYMGIEDLGRDLIAKKNDEILIIQCKYWSAKKKIHEKHVNQLYGTMVSYCIEHQVNKSKVKAILVTNIELSPMAKKMASYLGVEYFENYESGDYPCIKCNIGRGEYGETTRIYHLPFDQQYDSTKI